MTRPQFLNIPSLSFSREKRLKNGIHATVNGKSDLISRSSAEMGLKLLDTDPFVRQLKDDQARYVLCSIISIYRTDWTITHSLEEERDLFYERLDDTNSLEKSDRIVELEAIQKELKEFSSDVNEWVGTVKVSVVFIVINMCRIDGIIELDSTSRGWPTT